MTLLRGLAMLVLFAPILSAADPGTSMEKGTVRFEPLDDQKNIPERYRLEKCTFDYELSAKLEMKSCGTRIYRIRYPSQVHSPDPENDTVHGEYYLPRGKGPFPGVVMFDVIGGSDQIVARSLSAQLSARGIACLFIQMPYYGPRCPAGSKKRMISVDMKRSVENVRQAVLDGRCAAAWLAARPEIDGKRLGVMGTSLGSFMAALTAEMEPRCGRVAILMGGGGLVEAYYDDPRADTVRRIWEATGGSKRKLKDSLASVDPLTCADKLKERKVLMIAGKRDEIVLPKMTTALWKASGEQKLVWYDCTHIGSALYSLAALDQISTFFRAE